MNAKELLNDKNPQVVIETSMGEIKLELFPELAPITVENFLNLVDEKFYDGIIFHRVIRDFMIQGGDPKGIGVGGSSKKIKGEFASNGVRNDLKHTRGVISMARTM
ncbi:MAG: peptidylprolyl isomerase, partial [Acholeplasmatales bacterium]|nr:peptidylprolyl isomerase [Acholeplasmatales bacterium]